MSTNNLDFSHPAKVDNFGETNSNNLNVIHSPKAHYFSEISSDDLQVFNPPRVKNSNILSSDNLNVLYNSKDSNFAEISANKMICALSSIALEMQKFHAGTSNSYQSFGHNEDLSQKLSICKSNLRLKKKQIRLLKENLRKACIVAKTIISSKENMAITLHNNINSIKCELADLYEKNKTNVEVIKLLKTDNHSLQKKIQHLDQFITLGYKQLQKMSNVFENDASTVIKLKEIMMSCGQYYADYCNEQETRMQIEQKNRFLSNKINILTTNLEAVAEQLKNLRYENNKLRKENSLMKNKNVKEMEISVKDDKRYNEIICRNYINSNDSDKTAHCKNVANFTFDLTTHLALAKNLLCDQDNMLKDLRLLTEEVKNSF